VYPSNLSARGGVISSVKAVQVVEFSDAARILQDSRRLQSESGHPNIAGFFDKSTNLLTCSGTSPPSYLSDKVTGPIREWETSI
jgi:hypothetical protein